MPPPPSPPQQPVAPAFTLTSPSQSSNGGGAAPAAMVTATVRSAASRPPPLPGSFSAPSRAALSPQPLPPLRVTVSDPQRVGPNPATTPTALYPPSLLLATPHLSYRVAGDSSLPGFVGNAPANATTPRSPFSVRRRFSDFAALRVLLAQHHRGYVVPPLPDKAFVDAKVAALTAPPGPDEEHEEGGGAKAPSSPSSSSSSFVAVRTADLAAFMRAVVDHPVLRQSAALRVFLTHTEGPEGGAWKEAAAAAEAEAATAAAVSASAASASDGGAPSAPPPSPQHHAWRAALPIGGGVLALRCKHSLMSAAASLATAATSAVAANKQQQPPSSSPSSSPTPLNNATIPTSLLPPIPLSDDELALRAAREATADLDRLLGGAVAASRSLVGRMAALASDFGALGASLAAFSRYEDANARRGGQYTPEGARALERATVLQTAALGGGRSEHLLRAGAARAAASLVALHDLLALVPETAAVLEARERSSEDLRVLETESRDRLIQLQRARDAEAAASFIAAHAAAGSGPPKSREARRVAAAKAAYEAAEAQAASLRAAYAEEARRNRFEVDRLSLLRSSAQRAALWGLARSQRELAAAYGGLWASIEGQLAQEGE